MSCGPSSAPGCWKESSELDYSIAACFPLFLSVQTGELHQDIDYYKHAPNRILFAQFKIEEPILIILHFSQLRSLSFKNN
jgi:hypothetical protein